MKYFLSSPIILILTLIYTIYSTESLNSDVDSTTKQEVETSSSVDSLVSGLQKKLQILKTAQKSQQSTKTKSSEKSAESATLANNNSQKAEDFHEKNTKTNQAGGEGFQKAFKRFNSGSKNSTSLVVEKKPAEKINEDPIQIVNGKEEFYLRFDQEQLDLEYSKLKAEYEKNNSTNSIPKVNGKEKELYLRFAAQAQDHSKLEEAAEFEHSKNTGSITQWVINLEEKVHFF